MSSPAGKKQTYAYEYTRTVHAGGLSIRLWINASIGQGCDEYLADDIEQCAGFLIDEDTEEDDPAIIADRLMRLFLHLNAVEVVDDVGDGARVTRAN